MGWISYSFLCNRLLEVRKCDHSVYHAIPFYQFDFFMRNQCICVFETGNVEFESLLRRHKSIWKQTSMWRNTYLIWNILLNVFDVRFLNTSLLNFVCTLPLRGKSYLKCNSKYKAIYDIFVFHIVHRHVPR